MNAALKSPQTQDPEQLFAPRECEVCHGKRRRLLYRQRFVPMSEGSLLTGYNVVRCGHCGFCFADFLPGQDVFDRYYHDMSKYELPAAPAEPSRFDLDRFQSAVEKIQSFMPNRSARILEIGCATGLLLSRLKAAGYQNTAGLDPSPACCKAAGRLYGIPVQQGTLSTSVIEPGTVDLLIVVGVLEHIRDLETAFRQITRMLSPQGRVFVTVPDASHYAAGEDAPYQEFSLEHINYFGPGSLANLMSVLGFKCLFSEQALQPANQQTVTPVLHAAFQQLPSRTLATPWVEDAETGSGLEAYTEKSARDNEAIQPILRGIAAGGEPVIIWGAGSHTLRLLAGSPLGDANVTAIVDSNPRYQGKRVNGVPILKPEAIRGMPGTILISSRVFQESIRHQIHEILGLQNEVLTLYNFAS
jgi:SAM-dependent methyltransferase